MLGRAAQPVIAMPHLSADSASMLAKLAHIYRQGYAGTGGDAGTYELPLVFFTCVASTRSKAQQMGREAILRFIAHQHAGVDIQHAQHEAHVLEERKQLWFGEPADIIGLIEEHQAKLDNRHFVFWLDFGAMPFESVQESMRLLAEEVMIRFL